MNTVGYWMKQGLLGPAATVKSVQEARTQTALQGAFAITAPESDTLGMLGTAAMVGIALGLAVRGVASYYAGKAMAPNKNDATRWGWYGVVTGTFAGPLGLGILGGVALSDPHPSPSPRKGRAAPVDRDGKEEERQARLTKLRWDNRQI